MYELKKKEEEEKLTIVEYQNCPRLFGNFQDFKIALWKDTQAQNLLPKFILTTLKIKLKILQKLFFSRNNLILVDFFVVELQKVAVNEVIKFLRFLRYFQPFLKYIEISGFSYFHYCSIFNVIFRVS